MREISFRNDILPLKDKLYRLALRITLNSAEAEDVVQDTMIRVWNKRDEWPQFESIEAYCLTIARNLAIDRSQKMEAQNLQLTSEVREMPDTLTPYDRLAQNEQIQLVHRLVNELPERQRTTMQLRDVEGKRRNGREKTGVLDFTYNCIYTKDCFEQKKTAPCGAVPSHDFFTVPGRWFHGPGDIPKRIKSCHDPQLCLL